MKSNIIITSTEPVCRQMNTGRLKSVQVLRKQFPLVPVQAVTAHKAQVSTYNEVAIYLAKGMDRACLYVACNRVGLINSSGLYILGEFRHPAPPLSNHLVSTAMFRMRMSATVQFAFNNIYSKKKNLQQCTVFP
jgi:hypothetical protein